MTKRKLSYLALMLVGLFALIFFYLGNVEAAQQPNEDLPIVLEGTVVDISEDEVLFVARLNLSEEALERTFDEWLASDELIDLYRLNGIGSDVTIGTEIRISISITTRSLPPLAPVLSYEIINQ